MLRELKSLMQIIESIPTVDHVTTRSREMIETLKCSYTVVRPVPSFSASASYCTPSRELWSHSFELVEGAPQLHPGD